MMRLDDREWKDFAVPDIFKKIQRGKRLKNADHIPGTIPYVSSTANNNGVDDYMKHLRGQEYLKTVSVLLIAGALGRLFMNRLHLLQAIM